MSYTDDFKRSLKKIPQDELVELVPVLAASIDRQQLIVNQIAKLPDGVAKQTLERLLEDDVEASKNFARNLGMTEEELAKRSSK